MSDDAKHEIVIIRRGGHGDHDEHHGGVWKIAFADFMTAMMAFFLVMWLISANDKTRASVARYFNPVRLVDATTQPRGLHDSQKDESGITASPDSKDTKGGKESKATTKSGKDPKNAPAESAGDKSNPGQDAGETALTREKRLDAALHDNPYVALAEIAGSKGPGEAPIQRVKPTPSPVIGRSGGDAFRDPFAPPPPMPHGAAADEADATDAAEPLTAAQARQEPARDEIDADDAKAGANAKAKQELDKQARDKQAIDNQDAALKLRLLASVKPGRDGAGPGVDVKRTDEGLLVSLTDTKDFAMFSNGSAVPPKRVVLMMESIAQVLKDKPGSIVVRGYTDNKPFRSTNYDNWHLSLDRAQVTHYMLVRGGLADARVAGIEGFADRKVKAGVDPASPLNRRIEILLKDTAG